MDTVRRWAPAVGSLVVGVAVALLTWVRLGPVARETAWAEDAGIFLRERVALGPVDTVLHPYAGYLHAVPRLVVDTGTALPIEDYARTVAAACCVVVGIVGAAVFLLARDVVPAWPIRVLLGLVPAVVPLGPVEIAGNAANLHWYLLFAAPWVFSARCRSWWGAGVVALLALAVTLSEVQSVVFLPLLAVGWAGARWKALPVTIAALAGGAAQLVVVATSPRDVAGGSGAGVADVVAGYLLQPVASSWDGHLTEVAAAVGERGLLVVVVPFAALVALVVVAVVVGAWRARVLLVVLGVASGLFWAAAITVNVGADLDWATASPEQLAAIPPLRYAAAGSMFLLAAVVVAGGVLVDRVAWTPRWPRVPWGVRLPAAVVGWVLVTAVVASAVTNLQAPAGRRADGPEWRSQFTSATTAACRADPDRVLKVAAAPWAADVPCAFVLR